VHDIVKTLRKCGDQLANGETWPKEKTVYWQAADEIERLRKALSELADAVADEVNEKGGSGYILARLSDAREALKPDPNDYI